MTRFPTCQHLFPPLIRGSNSCSLCHAKERDAPEKDQLRPSEFAGVLVNVYNHPGVPPRGWGGSRAEVTPPPPGEQKRAWQPHFHYNACPSCFGGSAAGVCHPRVPSGRWLLLSALTWASGKDTPHACCARLQVPLPTEGTGGRERLPLTPKLRALI